MKVISVPIPTINLQSDVPNNVGIIDRWDRCKFRIVTISGHRNECLQYCLNTFYHNIYYIKKATILWSCVPWSKLGVSMLNENAFVYNKMLGYNTVIYNDVDKIGNLIGSMILSQRASSTLVINTLHIFNQLQIQMTKILTLSKPIISSLENPMFILIQKH